MDKVLITALAALLAAVSLADTAQDAADAAASAQAARLAAIDAKFYADKIVDAQDAASASASEAKTAAAEAKGVKRYLDQEIESALEDIGEAKTTAESAIEAKKDSELAYLQGFATDFEQQIKDGHVTVTNVNESYTFDYKYLYQYQNYSATTNVTMTIPANYSAAYVDGENKTRSNITVYTSANANGRIYAASTLSAKTASLNLQGNFTIPYFSNNTYQRQVAQTVIFKPSYMDYDHNGLRLHFIPTDFVRLSSSYSYNLVPKYFYWQAGKMYYRAELINKTSGAIQYYAEGYYSYDSAGNTFPNSFTGNRSFTNTGYTNSSRFLGQSFTQSTSKSDGLWFAESPALEDLSIIEWMNTGVLPENR